MADGYYNAPGAAASDAVTELLMQRQQLARQGAMDRLAFMKFEQDQKEATDALKEKQQEHQDQLDEKDKQTTLKLVGDMQIGDIPDADLIAKAKKYHIPLPVTTPPPPQAISQPGAIAPPVAPEGIASPDAPTGSPVTMTGMPAAPDRAPIRFAGDRIQQAAVAKEDRLAELRGVIAKSDPSTPIGKSAVLEYEMLSGKPISAALLPKAETHSPAYTEYTDYKKEQEAAKQPVLSFNDWETMDANRKKPSPGADNAERDRQDFHVDSVRHQTMQELVSNPLIKGTEDQIATLNKLDLTMRVGDDPQSRNLADSVVAEQVLKLTAGGAGSGLRLNNVLIDRILKDTRTKWESLNLKLNAWKDGKAPLSLDDDQRKAVRLLAAEGRKVANKTMARIVKARQAIDHAKTTDEAYDAQTALIKDLSGVGEDTSTSDTAPARTRTVYDAFGKPTVRPAVK